MRVTFQLKCDLRTMFAASGAQEVTLGLDFFTSVSVSTVVHAVALKHLRHKADANADPRKLTQQYCMYDITHLLATGFAWHFAYQLPIDESGYRPRIQACDKHQSTGARVTDQRVSAASTRAVHLQ